MKKCDDKKDKIDILLLDFKFKEKYKEKKNNINKYKENLVLLNNNLQLKSLTINIKNILKNNIEELRKTIDDIENNYSYNFYIMETSSLIDKYRKEIEKPVVVDFMSSKNVNCEDLCTDNIIKEYINIYKKYNTNFDTVKISNKLCYICNSSNIKYEENLKICIDCGNESNILLQTSSYKDSERINIVPKYSYDRKSHFKDCLDQYQGKQHVNIPQEIYDQISHQLKLNHILDNNSNNIYSQVTPQHILMFLKELKLNKYYDDFIYIYNHLTGNKINIINSNTEKKILNDFELLLNAYDNYSKNNKTKRKSFINSQYVLIQLLIKHKVPCHKDCSNILKTNDRRRFHDQICKELFKQLGWNFTCIF